MPYENEHAARLIDPGRFEQDSFRRKNIANGIDIIIGKLKGEDSMTTQAYRFDAKIFTADEAKEWLKKHDIKYISFEAASGKNNIMTHELKICDKGVKDLDEKGIVTFYFNAFDNVDSDNDMTKKGAFSKTISDNKGRIKHFKNHNIYLSPGVLKELGEDDAGAWARSALIMGTQLGRETYEEYKAGAITEHSFGYDVIKSLKNPAGYREIIEFKLWEVSSLNAWGANKQTPMIDIKNEDQLLRYLDQLIRLQKGDFSDEYLKRVDDKIKELSEHLATLRATTLEPEPEPFDAVKYLRTNLKILR